MASVSGLEGLTIGSVATAARVPKSTVQALFRERETLQAETLKLGVHMFTDQLVAELKAGQTPVERLQVLTEGWFDLVARKELPGGCLATAAAGEFRARPGALRDLILGYRNEWRGVLAKTALAAQAAGSIRADVDVGQLVFEIMALQTAANVALSPEQARDFERARQAVRRLLADAAA